MVCGGQTNLGRFNHTRTSDDKQRRCVQAIVRILLLVGLIGCGKPLTDATRLSTNEPKSTRPAEPSKGWSHQSDRTGYDRTFAIIIGVDDYSAKESDLEPLQFAVNDAREVRDLLRDEFGYAEERIRYLTEKDATRDAIRDAFEKWLPNQKVQPDDAVLVFFSGHGLIDKKQQGYLAAVDSRRDDLERTCVAASWLRDELGALACRHKLVILDSCYSGSLFQDKSLPMANAQAISTTSSEGSAQQRGSGKTSGADNLAYYLAAPAFLGMSAGRYTPVADGLGEQRHSVFTSALLKVLRERADSPREDHVFTFRQAASQIESRVANAIQSRQIPDWGRLGPGDGDFLFRPTVKRMTPREVSEKRRLISRWQQYAKDINLSQEAWDKYDFPLAIELLERHAPTDALEDLRGFEWHYLWRLYHSDPSTLRWHQNVGSVVFSPNGKYLATGGRTVKVWNSGTGAELLTLAGHHGAVADVSFSLDSRTIASLSVGDMTLRLWDVEAGHMLTEIKGHWPHIIPSLGFPLALRFRGDGTLVSLIWGGLRGSQFGSSSWLDVRRWAPDDGRLLTSHTFECDFVNGRVAFSPDGTTIATEVHSGELGSHKIGKPKFADTLLQRVIKNNGTKTIALIDINTGHTSSLATNLLHNFGTLYDMAFSSDGRFLACAGNRGIEVWDVPLRHLHTEITRDDPRNASNRIKLAFSHDPTQLAIHRDDKLSFVDHSNGNIISTCTAASGAMRALSPDGSKLAIDGRGNTIRIIASNCSDSQQVEALILTQERPVAWVGFAQNGQTVAAANGKTLVLGHSNSGKVQTVFNGDAGDVSSVAVSPDGETWATVTQPVGPNAGPIELNLWNSVTGQRRSVPVAYKGTVRNGTVVFTLTCSRRGG